MPYKEREIKRKYFSIGEVASLLNVNTSLIRFWESEFEFINPKKNKKGLRKYTNEDINKLKKIYSLLKEEGFTIDGARKHLKKNKNSSENNVVSKLEKLKNQLIEIKKKI
ncbi:MAG: MerR family transcriptional regulator [Bacteroidota bacterium]|nr:MerR family transcriptional regulator [Bacteroidota bacterium]